MHDSREILNNLLKLITAKALLFQQIMNLTKCQNDDIMSNDADNIEKLVEEKQGVIDRINELDKAFSVQLGLLKKELNITALDEISITEYPVLGQIKGKIVDLQNMARKIMELEKQNNDKLNEIYGRVKAELKQLSVGKKSVKAYEAPAVQSDGVYIDRKK